MNTSDEKKTQNQPAENGDAVNGEQEREGAAERRPYEAPSLTKKRSIARVTLFSGGGATAGGLTASG